MPPMDTLVHISAPTTNQNDDKHTQQALAYHGFLPLRRHDILKPDTAPFEQLRSVATGTHCYAGSTDKNEQTLQHGRRVLKTARKTISRSSNMYLLADDNLLDEERLNSRRSPISGPEIGADNPSDPDPVPLDSTQGIFDTQYAAARIESRVSTLSDCDDVPTPSTDSSPPLKRQRRSSNKRSNAAQMWDCKLTTAIEAISPPSSPDSMEPHLSYQSRRDSHFGARQSPAGSHSDIQSTLPSRETGSRPMNAAQFTSHSGARDLSPSTAMEREIAAFQALRQSQPRFFLNNDLEIDQLEEMVSSILPDTYGLSKPESGPVHGQVGRKTGSKFGNHTDSKHDSTLFHDYKPTEEALSVRSQSRVNARDIRGDKCLQGFGDDRAIATTEKAIAAHNPELGKHGCAQTTRQCEPSKSTMHAEFRNKIHVTGTFGGTNALCPGNPCAVGSSISTAYTPGYIVSRGLVEEDVTLCLRVPKPTKVPPISSPNTPHTSSPARKKDTPPKSQQKKRTKPVAEKKPITVQYMSPELEALKAIPRQIFPDPELEKVGSNAVTGSGMLSSQDPTKMFMEKHILYRRQMHRTLDPFERGHWALNLTHWAPSLQLQFLNDLQVFLEKQTAGPSPWAEILCDAHGLPESVNVYCDAAELGNVWMFLHVLSDRRLAQQDLEWIDWEGMPAVTMPVKPQKEPAKSKLKGNAVKLM